MRTGLNSEALRLAREEVRFDAVALSGCPKCGAAIGDDCVRIRGNAMGEPYQGFYVHVERLDQLIADLLNHKPRDKETLARDLVALLSSMDEGEGDEGT